jgi:hypothetical protein
LSKALSDHIEAVLGDAEELLRAHEQLRTGAVGRQWGLGGLNRSAVLMSIAAWECYVEQVVGEAIELVRPAIGPTATWQAFEAHATRLLGRFNTPNTANVRVLFRDSLTLQDVSAGWRWRGCSIQQSTSNLERLLALRHQTAHGVTPRPTVHNHLSEWAVLFVRRLAQKTDEVVGQHLRVAFGVNPGW